MSVRNTTLPQNSVGVNTQFMQGEENYAPGVVTEDELLARMAVGGNKNTATNGSGGQFAFIGYAPDGKGMYQGNFPLGTPKAAKSKRILNYIQSVWSKQPIPLRITENGETRIIHAQFDPTYDESGNTYSDATKLMGGNRHGTAAEQRVTLDLADDYYQIASEAKYNYSKDETGKETASHIGVKKWHYFINDIYFAEYGSTTYTPYRVTINIKEKADGHYVYSFSAEKIRESDTPQTLHAVVNEGENSNANIQLSNTNLPQNSVGVNTQFMQGEENYAPGVVTEDELLARMAEADRSHTPQMEQSPSLGYAEPVYAAGRYTSDGRILLNSALTTEQAIDFVLKHELTHSIESTGGWSLIERTVRRSMGEAAWTQAVEQVRRERRAVNDTMGIAHPEREVIANWIGENLYTGGFAKTLAGNKKAASAAVRILDRIRLALGGEGKSLKASQLAALERTFLQALESGAVRTGKITSQAQYALLNPNSLTKEVAIELLEKCQNGEFEIKTFVPISRTTPSIVINSVKKYVKLEKIPMVMEVGKVQQMMEETDVDDGGRRFHGIDAPTASAIFEGMFDPQYVVYQTDNNRIGVLVKMPRGYRGMALVVLDKGRQFNANKLNGFTGGVYNVSVTLYSLDDVQYYLNQEENIVRYEKGKENREEETGSHVPSLSNDSPYLDTFIPQNGTGVNTHSMQNGQKNAQGGQNAFLPADAFRSRVQTETSSPFDERQSSKNNSSLEMYSEEQYNTFGWASYNGVISTQERETLFSRYADFKHNRNQYPVTKWGEAVIHSTETPNVIMYVRASSSIEAPKITRIVKIQALTQEDAAEIREEIVSNEWNRSNQPYQSIEDYYGYEFFSIHKARDYASFREYQNSLREGRSSQESHSFSENLPDRGRSGRYGLESSHSHSDTPLGAGGQENTGANESSSSVQNGTGAGFSVGQNAFLPASAFRSRVQESGSKVVAQGRTMEELAQELGDRELDRRLYMAMQMEKLPTRVTLDGIEMNTDAYLDALEERLPDSREELEAYIADAERRLAMEMQAAYEAGDPERVASLPVNLQLFAARRKLELTLEPGEEGSEMRRFFWQRTRGLDANKAHEAELIEYLAGRSETYNPISNQETLDKAKDALQRPGYADGLVKRLGRYNPKDRFTEVEMAAAMVLINDAKNDGDLELYTDLVAALSRKGTDAGRAVQILAMQAKLTPEGTIRAARRTLRQETDRVHGEGTSEAIDELAGTVVDAVERAVEETEVKVSSSTSAISEKNKANNTLAYVLASNLDTIRDMAPVANLTGKEFNDRNVKLSEQIAGFFRSLGNKVLRNAFGNVELGDYGVRSIINHKPVNRAKIVSVAAVPAVIQQGRQIGYSASWKGRGYESYIFAAPVTVGDSTVFVAAVVDKRPDSKFYLSEMVDSNGNYVRIEESPSGNAKNGVTDGAGKTDRAGVTARPEGLSEEGDPSATNTEPTPYLDDSVPQEIGGVNPPDINVTGQPPAADQPTATTPRKGTAKPKGKRTVTPEQAREILDGILREKIQDVPQLRKWLKRTDIQVKLADRIAKLVNEGTLNDHTMEQAFREVLELPHLTTADVGTLVELVNAMGATEEGTAQRAEAEEAIYWLGLFKFPSHFFPPVHTLDNEATAVPHAALCLHTDREEYVMSDSKFIRDNGCKEAVCVDAGRVYDSCCDKDCIENMRLFFTEREQMLVDHATGIRAKRAEVITTYIDVEALPFNRGYYSCDLTFFFDVEVEVYGGHGCPCTVLHGVGVFRKKVILYGSEGNVRVFHSEYCPDAHDRQEMPTRNMPRCCVQVAEPVVLDGRLVDCCDRCRYDCGDCGCIPASLCNRYGGNFVDCADSKLVVVTLGIFSIVQLIRNVQMLMPVYDYCMPNKECCPTSENPCDLFHKMSFPVNEFFPPATEGDGGGGSCGCACGTSTTTTGKDSGCRRGC